ncbi:MAG: DUF5711 family protein [Velocimicrobium sp.]
MESLSQRNHSKRVNREKRKHKVTMAFTVTLCTIAAIALFAYIINGFINKVYYSYKVLASYERQDSNSVQYKVYQGKILKYSRDGASGITLNDGILWNGSYEMNNPVAKTCGDYVVIGDVGGKEAYVYNGTDSGTPIEETLPIIQVDVAKQGVIAVALEDTESNEIHIYNPYDSGNTLLFKIPTNVGEDGYPVDISLSEDGQKLVTSYLGINNGVMQNKVTFYNFGEVGETKTNFIVGGLDMGQELCPDVEFVNNDTICLYGEQGFMLYSMQEIPDQVCKIAFDNTIKNAMSNRKYIGFVLDDNTLVVYDLTGKKVLEQNIDYEYDEVYFSENEIIFTSDLSCRLMRFNGEVKWDYTFNKNIAYLLPAKEKNQYIIIDDVNIEKVKLSEEKES